MKKKTQGILITTTFLGLSFAIGSVGNVVAGGTGPSSSCINCHTDLEEMDSYGAASAKGGAAIAG